MNALEMVELTKVFKGKKGCSVQALTNLSLQIPVGEVFGFLGPNGAGKSTTIKSLIGLVKPTSGMAYLLGIPATDSAARAKVGYLPENPAFYDFMTAREYLHFVGSSFAMSEVKVHAESERVLELMELTTAADRPIRGYSKGMVQRLGLAQALLHDPDLYILDEPMSGLDPLGRSLVKEIIKELKKKGKTVFFSTHITADVEVVCDRVGVIAGGKLLAVDRVDSILRKGVEGYVIQLNQNGCFTEEIYVNREDLKDYLAQVPGEITIERIEPKRKDLEAFFLELIKGRDASH